MKIRRRTKRTVFRISASQGSSRDDRSSATTNYRYSTSATSSGDADGVAAMLQFNYYLEAPRERK